MTLQLRLAKSEETEKAFELFKSAADKIAKKKIDHWQYWKNPSTEKVKWVQEGFLNNEFFFIENSAQQIMGMVRIMNQDLTYWSKNNDKAKYIHSLVISEEFEGNELGEETLNMIAKEAKQNNFDYLRLDCDSKNPKLCQYYEKQGFVQVGVKTLPLSTYNLYQKRIL